jgi:hypothetical protein
MFDYTKDTGQVGIDHAKLSPHPDGKAWPKCCKGVFHQSTGLVSCAFVPNQIGGARLYKDTGDRRYALEGPVGRSQVQDTPFMCCHRSTDDGYHRVCAGWDACFGNKSR